MDTFQMSDNIQVAVRVRPLVESEISKGCKSILEIVEENNQIIIKDSDKAFSFNYVLSPNSTQDELYNKCIKKTVQNLFKGYNVTILAYGQTGSGKTHSMGTSYKGEGEMGVIPRASLDIFQHVKDNFTYDISVTVSFIELYKEVLYDLLADKPREDSTLDIREDPVKGNFIPGLTEIAVSNYEDLLEVLNRGSAGRVTGSTAMNNQSSRSHAIFTVNISMVHRENKADNKTSKLHLVDLAGSERPKKTGAVGNTFKEGVNINRGLFVLGNVISVLGEDKPGAFVPYRDSNLTRLLKDSLGGNSITLMVACVSPADYNLDETISTLRYADRARKIKNKPVVNQDPKSAEICELKRMVQQLRLQIIGQGGPIICPAEIELLKKEVEDLKKKIRQLSLQLSTTLLEKTSLMEKIMMLQTSNEALKNRIVTLKEQFDITINNLSSGIETEDVDRVKTNLIKFREIQQQFCDIDQEQKDAEKEIRSHEISIKNLVNLSIEQNPDTPIDVYETHTNQQMKLNNELQEISDQLMEKEKLAQQIAVNAQIMVDHVAMAENEEKIAQLEKEKAELLALIKNVQAQGAGNKLAEQRRKRVFELEGQISELKKKLNEQSRLIKIKERDEKRIKQLNVEILHMKQAKVKLVKTMREESERFRQWKMQRDRDIAKIKQSERKKETELARIKVIHEKQQNVFKRKVEEAAAVNKRLKEALAVRKQAQDMRNGKTEKVGQWLKQELDVFVSSIEAEATLQILLEHRATLQHELDELKKSGGSDGECKSIEEDLEMRSAQIQDLQQKLLDSDEETKSKIRFDNVQTMGEAKGALKVLFDYTADSKRKEIQANAKLTELQEANSELVDRLRALEEKMVVLEHNHQAQMSEMEKNNAEKISILLRQCRNGQGHSEEIITIEKEQLEIQAKQIEELTKSNNDLNEKLKYIAEVGKKNVTPMMPKQKITVFKENDDLNITFDIEEDDVDKDPDWRKTPLAKRIGEEKKLVKKSTLSFDEEKVSLKRSSEGGCTCRTDCQKRCGCKKLGKSCTSLCKCKTDNCKNKEDRSSDESSISSLEAVFKKPRDGGDGPDSDKLSLSGREKRIARRRLQVKQN